MAEILVDSEGRALVHNARIIGAARRATANIAAANMVIAEDEWTIDSVRAPEAVTHFWISAGRNRLRIARAALPLTVPAGWVLQTGQAVGVAYVGAYVGGVAQPHSLAIPFDLSPPETPMLESGPDIIFPGEMVEGEPFFIVEPTFSSAPFEWPTLTVEVSAPGADDWEVSGDWGGATVPTLAEATDVRVKAVFRLVNGGDEITAYSPPYLVTPEEEPAAVLVEPARLVFDPSPTAGASFAITPAVVLGTPFSGPTTTWEFSTVPAGEFAAGDAYAGGIVPAITEAATVRLKTSIVTFEGVDPIEMFDDAHIVVPEEDEDEPPAPLTAADITIVESVYRPTGQTNWFSPLVAVPGFPEDGAELFEWTAAPNFEGEEWAFNWHPFIDGGDGLFQLFPNSYPDYPMPEGVFDPSIWNLSNTPRLTRLRFRRRIAGDKPWSPASEPFTVPAPIVAGPPVLRSESQPINAVVNTAFSRALAPLIESDAAGLPLTFGKVGGAAQTWWIVDSGTGEISGIAPATVGSTVLTVRATNTRSEFVDIPTTFNGIAAPDAAPVKLNDLTAQGTVGTTTTLEGSAAVQGEDLVYAKTAGPAWGTINAATGRLTFVTPANAGNFTFSFTATNGAGSVTISVAYAATAVVQPGGGALPNPPQAIINLSLGEANIRYNFRDFDGNGGATRFKGQSTNEALLVAAKNGHAQAQAYTLAQLRFWCGGAFTAAGNRLPSGRGGVNMQSDMFVPFTVAVAQTIPAIWNQLTNAEKNILDLAMKGLLASCVFQNSDKNPYVVAGVKANERRMDGGQYGRGRVFNFTHPSVIVPYVVAIYMGGATFGANATQFLETFNRTQFANQLQAAGLFDMHQNFSAVLATGGRSGPTFAQFEASLKGYTYNGRGLSAAHLKQIIPIEINRCFSQACRPGVPAGFGDRLPTGCSWPNGQAFGIFEPTTAPGVGRPNQGRNGIVGRMADMTKWPLHQFQNQIGMQVGLGGTDGGDDLKVGNNGNNQPRSSMIYAMDEAKCVIASVVTLALLGHVDRNDAGIQAALDRQEIGVYDLKFRDQHGYRSFAKGGALWDGGATSGDWDAQLPQRAAYNITALWSLWDDVTNPWRKAA